jgi:hypothetical protein
LDLSYSRNNDVAKAMDYMLKRWSAFTRFNAAERGVRGVALGRKSWLFCGSDRGGERAAVMNRLIVTAKMTLLSSRTSAVAALAAPTYR